MNWKKRAGGEEHGFFDVVAVDEFLKQRPGFVDRHALAHLDGRAQVIHAQQDHLHEINSRPITAKSRNAKPPTALAAAWREPCLATKRATTSAP